MVLGFQIAQEKSQEPSVVLRLVTGGMGYMQLMLLTLR